MTVYRRTSARFPLCDGEGAKLYGGRWNSRGRAVVYAAATQSLAALEILAHTAALGEDYVVIAIDIPANLAIEEARRDDLAPPAPDPALRQNAPQMPQNCPRIDSARPPSLYSRTTRRAALCPLANKRRI